MHEAAVVLTSLALLAGVAAPVVGLLPRRRRSREQRLALVLLGISVLPETVPRLAGWSSLGVLVLSVLAFVPLAGFCYLVVRRPVRRA